MERGAAQVKEHGSGVDVFALTRRAVGHQTYLFDNVGHDDRSLPRVEHVPCDLWQR